MVGHTETADRPFHCCLSAWVQLSLTSVRAMPELFSHSSGNGFTTCHQNHPNKVGADPGGWGEPGEEGLGLPVPLDLSHIGHAPDTEAEVLAVQGAGDGTGNAGLANTGGAVETEDLALGRASELADSDELLQAEAPMRLQSLAAFLQSKGCA